MGTGAAEPLYQGDSVSVPKPGIDVHLRIPPKLADQLDELAGAQSQPSRNALIVRAIRDAVRRMRDTKRQRRCRARRQQASGE